MKIKDIIPKIKLAATKKNIIKISLVAAILIMSMFKWGMNVISPIIVLVYVGYLLAFNSGSK